MKNHDNIRNMLINFFRKWWLTRSLNKYISSPKRILDLEVVRGSLELTNSDKDQRIGSGVHGELFTAWLLENILAKWLYKDSKEIVEKTALDCHRKNWIEIKGEKWNIDYIGRDVYVWYYPFLALTQFLGNNKYGIALLVGFIGYAPIFRPLIIKTVCLLFPMLKFCNCTCI